MVNRHQQFKVYSLQKIDILRDEFAMHVPVIHSKVLAVIQVSIFYFLKFLSFAKADCMAEAAWLGAATWRSFKR